MMTVSTPTVSDENLIARAAEGDTAARQDLAARVRKLRWLGSNDEAKLLVAKIGASLSDAGIDSAEIRETD